MQDVRLTAGDVAEIAGLPPRLVIRWAEAGVLTPAANAASGKGHRREFTLQDATAASYGSLLIDGRFPREAVTDTVQFLATLAPGEIERAIDAGQTFVLPFEMPPLPRLLKPTPWNDEDVMTAAQWGEFYEETYNLATIVERVKRKAAEIAARSRNGRGRHTALQGAGPLPGGLLD